MSFVHLHVHSCYSLLDGAIRLPDLVATAKAMGMPAVALTDHGQMFGLWSFHKVATEAGIKPILGVEAYVTNMSLRGRDQNETRHHLVLLAKDLEGYRNLCRMISVANVEGIYNKPRIDLELLGVHAGGLICLSGCLQGEIPRAILAGREDMARAAAERFARMFPGDFYLELQENRLPSQALANKGLADLADRLGLPVVATNDCHYLTEELHDAHDVLLCVQTGKKLADERRMRMETREFFFKSPERMARDFAWRPDALASTLEIASKCQVVFPPLENIFPAPPVESGAPLDEVFSQKARQGLARRLERLAASGRGLSIEAAGRYRERLEEEIAVINSRRFPGYFLIVADFIGWAKSHSIPVGPGRGSAVGSLAAWALGITDVDPIRYDLLFERFLNPERMSLPDIDVDFCAEGRAEVIRYVTETYGGGDYVGQICAMGQLKARAVVRDVGRALDLELPLVDRIAKMIPAKVGITLTEAMAAAPEISAEAKRDPRVAKTLEFALLLENLPRHASTHASGVVISDRPLRDVLPLFSDAKSAEEDGRRVQVSTQYELGAVEANGLIKFDFLGLKTLTLIKHCLRLLAERGVEVDLEGVDLNDPLPYELMAKGDVTGVFQIENSGIRGMVARLKPTCIEDVIAIVALYRPGPLKSGMVDGFIKIKHGLERPHYELELIRPILEETLGVIVYQEQVMRIAQVLAGYSLGEADLLRRAMGKKKPEEMAKQMSRFMAGAAERGVPAEKAAKVFELMSYFAEYGFNKSHSAAYAMITYRTAWLKAHYPLEFMAALMTSEHDNLEKISGIIKECRKRGIPVRPPDVNASALKFTAAGDSIVFGLGAIKGVGQGAVEAILEARRDGPFEDIFDFCARAGNQKVNRRVIESLIKCGAFDACGGAPRESLLACLDEAMAAGAKTRQKKARPQASLFAGLEPPPKKARRWPEAVPMTEAERLGLEKDLLGFYISGHPLDRFEPAMAAVRDAPLSRVARLGDQSRVRVCGTLGKVVQKLSKNNKPYAFVTIEDSDASAELAVWSNVLSRRGTILTEGRLVVVDGVVDRNGEKDKSRQKIICDDIRDFGETLAKGIASLTIASPLSELDAVVDFLAARSDPGDQAAGDQAGAGPAGARQSGAGQEGASGAAPAETGTAAVFLGIDDGVGRAVYRLDRKVALSVEFFREADRLLPLEAAGSLRCSSSPYPFGANA